MWQTFFSLWPSCYPPNFAAKKSKVRSQPARGRKAKTKSSARPGIRLFAYSLFRSNRKNTSNWGHWQVSELVFQKWKLSQYKSVRTAEIGKF